MLKHVQISPIRNRSDSISLRSTASSSCASSICGSPEPTDLQRTASRASSYSSLNETLPQTTIKVFTKCLRIDIEYKTLGIQWDTTSKEVINQLLRRLKMRHRDPRLFYLSMEVTVRRPNVKTILVLDDEARPAILQACHPKGDSRFCLQLKPGGLIRVHTSALQSSSQYKSLVISQETTSDELLSLLLSCYSSIEPVEQFSLYEVCPGQEYQRKLHPDDIPLRAQTERLQRGETCHFLVRRNPNYPRRRLLSTSSIQSNDLKLPEIINTTPTTSNNNLFDFSNEKISTMSKQFNQNQNQNSQKNSIEILLKKNFPIEPSSNTNLTLTSIKNCTKCRNSFKSCEFCNKNSITLNLNKQNIQITKKLQSYNPVYNIREIRTVNNSFSSLGNDKKFLDIELGSNLIESRSNSIILMKSNSTKQKAGQQQQKLNINNDSSNNLTVSKQSQAHEAVNNNPSKGLGHFVYI